MRQNTLIVRQAAILLGALVAAGAAAGQESNDAKGHEFFEKRIRPVLAERCYGCHSARAKKVKASFFLDSRSGLREGGVSGLAIVPGDPERSLLVRAIRYADPELQMPPKDRLSRAQVADIEAWIRMGAPDPRTSPAGAARRPVIDLAEARKYWAFRPVVKPDLPEEGADGRNPLDTFILARLRDKGLRPVARADKQTLIRRATFDLIGLPPAPGDVDAFVADASPRAFARVVERLLSSRHYGERWGRHWLDVVRYADTAGDSSDFPVPQAVRYRDYVIRAFNDDKPYDRFIREQVAGDLLPANSPEQRAEQIVATGYLALSRKFGIVTEKFHHLTIEDTIDNLGQAILGLGIGCARCHEHKFDPIPQEDYYALYGIFQSTRYPYTGSEKTKFQKDFVPLVSKEEADRIVKPWRDRLAAVEEEMKRLAGKGAAAKAELKRLKSRRDALVKERPKVETAYAISEGDAGDARVHLKGDPETLGKSVHRGFLTVLGGQKVPTGGGSGRLLLAGWLTDPANPLTARVMANRIWQYHFGRGLVATPSSFGKQGRPPTHPELLDYLAARFVESGWSVKAMHRLIMLSEAYTRAGRGREENVAVDPDNELLWKFAARRLEAEAIRDAMLAVTGELDLERGGTHPFPPPHRWNYSQAQPYTARYSDFDHRKRTVYWMTQRLRKRKFMETFDGPDPNISTAVRTNSTTPLQALFMMNDSFVHERANKFAARLISARPDDARRIDLAYQLTLARAPEPEERTQCLKFLQEYRRKMKANDVPGEAHTMLAWSSLSRVLFGSNEFIFLR